MKTEKVKEGLYRITHSYGKVLTQSELPEDVERVFCDTAFELTEDDSSKWVEWTIEEMDKWEEEHKPEPPNPMFDN